MLPLCLLRDVSSLEKLSAFKLGTVLVVPYILIHIAYIIVQGFLNSLVKGFIRNNREDVSQITHAQKVP